MAGHEVRYVTMNGSTFVGCSCHPDYWMSRVQGDAAALALLHPAADDSTTKRP